MTYTALIRNEMLGSARYCGTFATVEEAIDYCVRECQRVRSFVTLEPVRRSDRATIGTRWRGVH